MKNKGFTIIELIATFTVVSVILILLFQLTISLRETYTQTTLKGDILSQKSIIEDYMSTDFLQIDPVSVNASDANVTIVFTNGETKTLSLDKNNTILRYGDYAIELPQGTTFGPIEVSNEILDTTEIRKNNSLLKIEVPILNSYLDEDMSIEVFDQYDNRDLGVVYSYEMVNGATFNNAVKGLSNYDSITSIVFDSEINTTNYNASTSKLDLSLNQDNSVVGYTTGSTLHVQADGIINANTDLSQMFYQMTNITNIKFGGYIDGNPVFNTINTTNMYRMFRDAISITSLDLTAFKTDNVTNMSTMMYHMTSLTDLKINTLNTSNVTNMSWMFAYLTNLSTLELSNNFDTSSVTNMSNMFYNMINLTTLDLGDNFNTSNVTNMSNMFNNITSITSLDFKDNFDTSKVTDMSWMFQNLDSVQILDLSNFKTPQLTTMQSMFYGMDNLETLIFGENFTTSNVTNMIRTFDSMGVIEVIDLTHFDTSKVVDMNSMFSNSRKIKEIILSDKFNTINVTNMEYMFNYTYSLESVDLSILNTANVENMRYMFRSVAKESTADGSNIIIGNWDTSKVTNMSYMFETANLPDAKLNEFIGILETANVTTFRDMFANVKVTTLNVSNFDTSNATEFHGMFGSMPNVTSITFGTKFNTSKSTTFSWSIHHALSLKTLDISMFDITADMNLYAMFYNTPLETIYVKSAEIGNLLKSNGHLRSETNVIVK